MREIKAEWGGSELAHSNRPGGTQMLQLPHLVRAALSPVSGPDQQVLLGGLVGSVCFGSA